MLEILMLVMMLLAAARKGKGRRRFNLRRVRTIPIVALATLADATVVVGAVTGSADGAYRAMSHKAVWSLRGLTAGEGPITVGYAYSDYSVTEIKEALEIANSISIGSKLEQEKANRLVRVIGQFAGQSTDETLNDGKPMTTRLNWFVPIGKAVNIFAYNESGAQLNTGASVQATGDLWVKDT